MKSKVSWSAFYSFVSEITLLSIFKVCNVQGFIQAILMSIGWHKFDLHKFYFKARWHWTCIQNINLQYFFYLKLFICPADVKRSKNFQGLYSLNPQQDSIMTLLQSLQPLKTPTCVLLHLKTQSLYKQRASVKLLG